MSGKADDRQKLLLQGMLQFSKTASSPAAIVGQASSPVPTSQQTMSNEDSKNKLNKLLTAAAKAKLLKVAAQLPNGKANSSMILSQKSVSIQTPVKQSKQQSTMDVHFSGSAFLSSPDPSMLPFPAFAGEDSYESEAIKIDSILGKAPQSAKSDKKNSGGSIAKKETKATPKKLKSKENKPNADGLSEESRTDIVSATSPDVVDKSQILMKFLKVRKV
jgi:hypothetical protein